MLANNQQRKGDCTSRVPPRIAGIKQAKNGSELIPLCHPVDVARTRQVDFLNYYHKTIALRLRDCGKLSGKTGLNGSLNCVSVCRLGLCSDMCKAFGCVR